MRLKKLYADSTLPRDQGFKNLVWNYDPDPQQNAEFRIKDEPDALKILKEINGYQTATGAHLQAFGDLKDDGSTTCASWIYCGVYPEPAAEPRRQPRSPTRRRTSARPPTSAGASPGRPTGASCTTAPPPGRTASPGASASTGSGGTASAGPATTCRTSPLTKAPNAPADPNGIGLDGHSGTDPFIMKPDGKGWLFAPTGLVDGPLPTHYEPVEAPIKNPLYAQQTNPVLKYWERDGNALAQFGDPRTRTS